MTHRTLLPRVHLDLSTGGGNDVEEKVNTLSDAGGGGEESDEGSQWL